MVSSESVVLDREMVGVERGRSEIGSRVRCYLFSGETLVNTLVQPKERVIDWHTRYCGVTQQAMNAATMCGDALEGWRTVRAAMCEHIDDDTILVGQSLQHDLDVLRMIHLRVVDAGILARMQ